MAAPHIVLSDQDRRDIYEWVDMLPLSRPKKFIARDFSDACMMAEVIAHFLPRLIEMHNYPAALSVSNKRTNWVTLQQKVLKKLRIRLSDDDIEAIIGAKPGAIERLLFQVRACILRLQAGRRADGARAPERPGHRHSVLAAEGPAEGPVEGRHPPVLRLSDIGGAEPDAAAPPPPRDAPADADADAGAGRAGLRLRDLQEENALLSDKLAKMGQLLQVKDARIDALNAKVRSLTLKLQGADPV